MARIRQTRKRRSSRPTVRQSNKPKKLLNPLGNDIIARNWDKNQTMTQNYRRLGLVSRINKPTGGTEPQPHAETPRPAADPLAIVNATSRGGRAAPASAAGAPGLQEVRVERDEQGRIVRVLRQDNPLNDPLNALDSDDEEGAAGPGARDDGEEWGGIDDDDGDAGAGGKRGKKTKVVRALEREASQPVVKKVRHQSEREREWLQRLVDKHGDDTAAMTMDMKLNPMQQTAADLARRLKKWKASQKA